MAGDEDMTKNIGMSDPHLIAVPAIKAFSTVALQISANLGYADRSDPSMQASVASQPHLYNASPIHRAPP